ncbi:MAG: SMP-30/gluconolactonase/LRE family protein [Alphaproteobacteria bacterium]|nr:SMP-30/gluconolactonase/LRE family protein [Alphaproteobacteria bacterium]
MTQTRRAFLATGVALTAAAYADAAPEPFGTVQRLSPKLDELIAPDAKLERLGGGVKWAEGPVWVKDGGYLLFSDPPKNTMYRWSQMDGISVFLHPSGYAGDDLKPFREPGSNGLAIDARGALIAADSGNRGLTHIDLKTKRKHVFVDRYEGKRFNSPNDLCIARSGAIYFTDPPYGLAGLEKSPAKELPFSGVYRWTPDGKVALIDQTFLYPNGVALSPDETTLYISNTDVKQPIIRAYQLGADGMPTSFSTLFDTTPLIKPGVPGMPDGMKVDAAGNLFAAGPGGIMVLTKEGELLGIISAGKRAMPNCAFGEDGHSLFLAATDSIARIRVKTHGQGWT